MLAPENKLTIVMYHYVRDIKKSNYPNIKGLEFDKFKEQLDIFSQKFTFISINQLYSFYLAGVPLPENSCLLTFDDGFKDHINFVMPELLKRGIQGLFFPPGKPIMERELLDVHKIHFILNAAKDPLSLISALWSSCLEIGIAEKELKEYWNLHAVRSKFDSAEINFIKRLLQFQLKPSIRALITSNLFEVFVTRDSKSFADELYLSVEDCRKLIQSDMIIGSHGYEHFWMDKISRTEQEDDLDKSLKFLTHIGINLDNWIMFYPYGAYNLDSIELLKQKKCFLAFTDNGGLTTLNHTMRYKLTRYDTNDLWI